MRAVAGVAKLAFAPYGAAVVEALKNADLWDNLEKKIVNAPSIAIAKQFADTGNVEAAFTALALTVGQTGTSIPGSEKLHKPIEQALGIIKDSSPDARKILKRFGDIQR